MDEEEKAEINALIDDVFDLGIKAQGIALQIINQELYEDVNKIMERYEKIFDKTYEACENLEKELEKLKEEEND